MSVLLRIISPAMRAASLCAALALAFNASATTTPPKSAASAPASAAFSGPKRDITVEFRQIEEGRDPASTGSGGRYGAGSGGSGANAVSWEPQMLQVRNGEKAKLQLTDAIPMQWVSGVQAPVASNGTAGTGSTGSATAGVSQQAGAGVQNSLVWFDSGQSMTVSPKWPGGNQSVVLEIEVQRPFTEPRMGADLPNQTRNSISTTVTLPLAQWITIAATGRAAREGIYSSESGLQVRRLLQVRVMAP